MYTSLGSIAILKQLQPNVLPKATTAPAPTTTTTPRILIPVPVAKPVYVPPVLKQAPTATGTTPTVSSGGQSFPASGGGQQPVTLQPVPKQPTIQYYPASNPTAPSSGAGEGGTFNMAGFGGMGLVLAAMLAIPLLLKRKG